MTDYYQAIKCDSLHGSWMYLGDSAIEMIDEINICVISSVTHILKLKKKQTNTKRISYVRFYFYFQFVLFLLKVNIVCLILFEGATAGFFNASNLLHLY